MQNRTNTEFSSIEVWFTDQNSKRLETEDNVNMTLILGYLLYYKNEIFNQNQSKENMLKDMAFCHLLENLEINMVKN